MKGNAQVTLLETWPLFADAKGDAIPAELPDLLHPNLAGYAKWAAALRPIFATLGFLESEPYQFTPEPGFVSLFNGKDLAGWGFRPTPDADKESARKWQAGDPNAPPWPIVTNPVSFDGQTSSPDGRFVAKNGRLTVTTPPEGRRIQQLSTTRNFPKDFILRLEFRATPNADSGIFLRDRQLQCRDYPSPAPTRISSITGLATGTKSKSPSKTAWPQPLQRRSIGSRDESSRHRSHRPRRRPRSNGIPPHPHQRNTLKKPTTNAHANREFLERGDGFNLRPR